MKKKGMVYNVTQIDETVAGKHIRVDSFKDGTPKTVGRQFDTLSDATYWITEVNMWALKSKEIQININLK